MTSPTYYFDHNATTPVAPEVLEAMLPMLREHWANPSSAYQSGHEVAKRLEKARAQVAALIEADPREIVFTSGGTESNNAALHSATVLYPDKRHLITTAVEHSATLRYVEFLEQRGYEVTYLTVDAEGALDLAQLESAIRPETALVSIMWANNETGVLFPIDRIATICCDRGVMFHTDAIQAAGKVHLDSGVVPVDFLSLSAHKLYAPKGIGALFVRRRSKFQPLILGGQQEHGRRGGTENTAHIVGFGAAAELARERLDIQETVVRELRDRLEAGILNSVAGTVRNGAASPRLPNTTNLAFADVEAEAILIGLDRVGICASSGSACMTGSLEPSHVLKAMGFSAARARGSVRFSLGLENTEGDVNHVLEHMARLIAQLRGLS